MSHLDEILTLDPERDHQRIVHLDVCYEFPFDITRSLEFALFRTYCVPGISGLLARTGEFLRCPQKRYDDTDVIISELMEWGYDSERGCAALERMNAIHGRFQIANDDYLYVLSTFVFEPIRWNARFGWRPMCEQERLAFFHFWQAVGRRMGVRDIPQSYSAFEQFNLEYERSRFVFSESNRRIGEATRELFASWFPRLLRPAVRRTINALLDEPVRKAFGFPSSPGWLRALVVAALKLRAWLVARLPARRRPRLRSEMARPTYPMGYRMDEIGPDYMRQERPSTTPAAAPARTNKSPLPPPH
jgi:hypothetical protein